MVRQSRRNDRLSAGATTKYSLPGALPSCNSGATSGVGEPLPRVRPAGCGLSAHEPFVSVGPTRPESGKTRRLAAYGDHRATIGAEHVPYYFETRRPTSPRQAYTLWHGLNRFFAVAAHTSDIPVTCSAGHAMHATKSAIL